MVPSFVHTMKRILASLRSMLHSPSHLHSSLYFRIRSLHTFWHRSFRLWRFCLGTGSFFGPRLSSIASLFLHGTHIIQTVCCRHNVCPLPSDTTQFVQQSHGWILPLDVASSVESFHP